MAKEELKWQNIDADDLPAEVKKSASRNAAPQELFGRPLLCWHAERI
jgi:hypothetical protein